MATFVFEFKLYSVQVVVVSCWIYSFSTHLNLLYILLVVCGPILLQTVDSITVPAEGSAPCYLFKVLFHMCLLSIPSTLHQTSPTELQLIPVFNFCDFVLIHFCHLFLLFNCILARRMLLWSAFIVALGALKASEPRTSLPARWAL